MNSILLHPSHVKFKLHDVEHRIIYAISKSKCINMYYCISANIFVKPEALRQLFVTRCSCKGNRNGGTKSLKNNHQHITQLK